MTERRFPPPWSADEPKACFIVKDSAGQKLAFVYYEEEPGRRSAAKLLTKDEARRIAANIAKMPDLLSGQTWDAYRHHWEYSGENLRQIKLIAPRLDYGTAMPAIRICIAVSLALCFAAGPAQAQFWGNGWHNGWRSPHHRGHAAHKPPAQTSGSPEEPAAPDKPAPYDSDLQRLSEILGALHFLRGVCNSGEGEKWRSEAKALIDAEAPSGNRHDQMVASFNRGYSGFQQTYRICTPSADIVIRRYMEEGAKISRDITARYAN